MPSEYVLTRSFGALRETDAPERLVDPPLGCDITRGGDDLQVLAAGQVWVEARLLDDRADAGERLAALRRLRQAEQADLAGGRLRQPEQRADHRRLARAVRAEEAECDAGADDEVDTVDRGPVAEALRQRPGLDHRFHVANATRPVGYESQLRSVRVRVLFLRVAKSRQ